MQSDCFKIERDKVYQITEKVTDNTPPELRQIGRGKEIPSAAEPITCAYYGDPEFGSYDTGLTETSRDFNGLKDTEVSKILKARNPLKTYLDNEFSRYKDSRGDVSLTEFLSSDRCTLVARHGLVVDTHDFHNYFKLYLATRSNQLAPSCDEKNPKYNSADFVIKELSNGQTDSDKMTLDKIKRKLTVWFDNTYNQDPEMVKQYLTYVGAMSYGRKATEGVMFSIMEKWIDDRDNGDRNAEYLLDTIENTDEEDILIMNQIGVMIRRKKIFKGEGGAYVYDGRKLGRSKKEVFNTVTKEGNEDLLEFLLENIK